MRVAVHQPQYLPWLGYFDKIARSDCFVFLDKVQYKQREFQNRNKIRTASGWTWLTVPVISKGLHTQLISEVRLNNTAPWGRKHLTALKTSYQNTPFFDNYFPFFQDSYSAQTWERLVDLNLHIINYLLKQLKIERPLHFESELGTTTNRTQRIIEICQKLSADTYLSGAGGKDYLEEGLFKAAGIKLEYQQFQHPVYAQHFARTEADFLPCLSALDLLFNHGEKSSKILEGELGE